MSIFTRLINRRTEDFFTELVAYLFVNYPPILAEWLKTIDVMWSMETDAIQISTQVQFGNNRPDMVIEIKTSTGYEVIFIESKVGSTEGPSQLNRYAQALIENFSLAQRRILVYITRDFEPKEKDTVLDGVSFQQTRWKYFYQVLERYSENHKTDTLIQEAIGLMKELNMQNDGQLSPLDIVTIENMARVINLMQASLSEEVQARFKAIWGNANMSNLTDIKARFTLQKSFQQSNGYCGLGFYFDPKSAVDTPTVRLHFGASKKGNSPEIVEALLKIAQKDGWQTDEYPDWFATYRSRPITDFLATKDSQLQLKAFFSDCLDELEEIKRENPHLSW